MRTTGIALFGTLSVLAWGTTAPAAVTDRLPEIHGFVQAHAAARLGSVECAPRTTCSWPYNEQRLQLKTEGDGLEDALGYAAKLDLLHDAALGNLELDVRKLHADYNAERFTVRVGRQVVTWGVADLLFINDTFPKDWVSFFGGLPLEYLKLGSNAVRLDLFPEFSDLELVLADFRKDRLPDRDRFVLPGPDIPTALDEPSGLEASLRASRHFGSWDAALYFSHTHYRAPALSQEGGRAGGQWRGQYPRMNAYGASLSGSLGSGVLSLETGYYDSIEDRDGTRPAIENSQTRFLVGYSRQVAEDTTLGLQAYAEWMHHYDAYRRALPEGFPRRDELRTVATLRFTQFHIHQTLRLGLFAFWGLSEHDGYIIPSVRYTFSDALWGEVGANLFVGDRAGQFGALGDDDNLYATVRYAF
ncbi:DUF1302 family protein [Candidatus Thiosymbion oneisti]|uniref:DUF1302 family protein n=1 Tax=Candidatus Thiosymbion oneisti TaxID=589554 RepID=UPI00105F2681|nr:DUF1302 family protein [Candidatus Thiosymbion oneisti]